MCCWATRCSCARSHRRHANHEDGREIRERGFPRRKLSGPCLLFVRQIPQTVTADLWQTQPLDCATAGRECMRAFLALANDAELVSSDQFLENRGALGFRRVATGFVGSSAVDRKSPDSLGSIRSAGRSTVPRLSELSD